MPSVLEWIRKNYHCDASPVHRIDRDTSGVVLFSTDRKERAHWGHLFTTGQVEKVYLAFVLGHPPTEGIIDTPLYDRRRRRRLDAETHFEMHHCFMDCAYIAVSPHTGRRHQIRQHLANIGHPILGDPRYPSERRRVEYAWKAPMQISAHIAPERRMWLHAHTLATSDAAFRADEPKDFRQFGHALSERENQQNGEGA
jgi:23S rRNA-/tRNA-specific pseudouridylate synthase